MPQEGEGARHGGSHQQPRQDEDAKGQWDLFTMEGGSSRAMQGRKTAGRRSLVSRGGTQSNLIHVIHTDWTARRQNGDGQGEGEGPPIGACTKCTYVGDAA